MSYIPGEIPRKEPAEIPRLFIQGFGGSIKIDVGGVGARLSDAAFAYRVPDNSLDSMHIRCGDIVLIDPVIQSLRVGSLLLLELDGQTVFRRLQKKKRFWYLDLPSDGAEAVALSNHALQGVAVGVVRLFTKLRPVKFRGTEANYHPRLELQHPGAGRKSSLKPEKVRSRSRPIQKLNGEDSAYMTDSKHLSKVSLTERDEKIRYRAWPNNR